MAIWDGYSLCCNQPSYPGKPSHKTALILRLKCNHIPLHSLGLCRWRSYWTSCFHSQLVQAEPVQLGSTDPGINSRANPGSIHQNAVLDKRGTRLDLSPLTSRETCWSCRDLPLFDRRPAALTILYSLVWYLSNYSLSWTEIIITGYTYPKSRFIKTRFSG